MQKNGAVQARIRLTSSFPCLVQAAEGDETLRRLTLHDAALIALVSLAIMLGNI